jgi:hypothetical protein
MWIQKGQEHCCKSIIPGLIAEKYLDQNTRVNNRFTDYIKLLTQRGVKGYRIHLRSRVT